jgi:catechol 2,3-dioxygenase-like lactoylglutathione lyase family enzyme
MIIDHVLAVVPVSDLDRATAFYGDLLGRAPDNTPMPGQLVEWQVREGGWLQVNRDDDRAGRGQVNLAVPDVAAAIAELGSRGVATGEVVDANRGVQLCAVSDPDGNAVTLIGGFRVRY